MGFLGKMFEKKECAICGGEIGLLGNRKLNDGNLCKDCASKLSVWFTDRRKSTVEDIRKQLEDREENKKKIQQFQITKSFKGSARQVYIDETKGWFAIANKLSVEENPDILNLTQITGCRLDVNQNRTEEYYKDTEGKNQSYNPPRYKYSYDYKIELSVNAPWFDEMTFQLTTFSIPEQDRERIMETENLGNRIIAALTGRTPVADSGTGNPAYAQAGYQPNYAPSGEMPGYGAGYQPNYAPPGGAQGYQQNYAPPGGAQGYQPNYAPPGGAQGYQPNYAPPGGAQGYQPNYAPPGGAQGYQPNYAPPGGAQGYQPNYAPPGGAQGYQPNYAPPGGTQGYQSNYAPSGETPAFGQQIRCDKCGWTPENTDQIPKFCPNCGDRIDWNDAL